MSETEEAALAVVGFFGLAGVLAFALRGLRTTLALVVTVFLATVCLILAGVFRSPVLDWAAGLLFAASAILRYAVEIASWVDGRKSRREG